MRLPRFPKIKIPKWFYNIRLPKFFQSGDSQKAFYYVWKKFLRQIPPESRPTINSYQHFIVLGYAKSGKTDLIQGLTEQSQDLYPFDTSYTSDPDIQFYLGPNQVVQEISFSALEDRSVKIRRKTIRLWKKLYARRDPIIIINYNCFSKEYENLRDLNRLAQLIAGKISLLSEITKKPLKVRIALTHLDKMPGYLEFARFLKQENLTFQINISSNFESNTLQESLKKFFEEYLNLMLISSSQQDFAKMLLFSKEMPLHLHSIEEFLRALVARVSFVNSIELDTLSFTSNQESSTSFNPFQWVKQSSMEIFFRYPMLKHQLASAGLFVLCLSMILHLYMKENKELSLARKGIDHLNLLQNKDFQEKIIPAYVASLSQPSQGIISYLKPNFFGEKLEETKNNLADRIHKHYIDPGFRKAILESKGEIKCLYFLGLMHATRDNHLGRFILENSKKMAEALNISENLLVAYINSTTDYRNHSSSLTFSKINTLVPFTSMTPWLNFLKKIQEISSQPIFVEHNFEGVIKEADRLLAVINRLHKDPLPFAIATLLDEEKGPGNTAENIEVIRWVGENRETLSDFLLFIKMTSNSPVESEGMNIAQFYTKIKKMSTMANRENQTYNITIRDQLFSFDTKTWTDLVVAHNVERAIQNYIASNNNTEGEIFFRNTAEANEPLQPISNEAFPRFANNISIPGRYTRLEFENKVRSSAEKLTHLVDSLDVNPEEKRRFSTFLVHEVINYMKHYQDYYAKFFHSCDIQNVSLDGMKKILKDLTHETSSFHDFLNFIQYQTGAFSEPIITLKNVSELNHFDFLNRILTRNGGEAPFAEYQKIMKQLLADLESESAQGNHFQMVLSPFLTNAARISSDILQNNSRSYVHRVKECLTNLNVPERYHAVFLKPVLQVNKLGLIDLKKGVENAWAQKFQSKIDSILSKFPFNLNETEIVSYEELDKVLNPRGEFYKTIMELMMACGGINEGKWSLADAEKIQINENIFASLNKLQSITDLLWDKEGNPQPINLYIKAVPFTHTPQENPVIVYSYLVVGEQCVRNLNQTPTWQNIKIDWWKDETCSVGVELMDKYKNVKSFKSIQKLNSKWGFFELLKDSVVEEGNILTWKLTGENESQACQVSLCFERDPHVLLLSQN